MMQGIFHRSFVEIHTGAAKLLDQPIMAVFRGEGGEIERRPNKPAVVYTSFGKEDEEQETLQETWQETWQVLLDDTRQEIDLEMNIADMLMLWRGEKDNPYGVAALTGTLAIALKALGKADNETSAQNLAEKMWHGRNKNALPLG
jgi:anthranilate phosphoribosyltransferase